MSDQEVLDAIDRAKDGIGKYILIMDALYAGDVTKNADFQRQYNGLYRVRQRKADWYKEYFQLMEESKKDHPSFAKVLRKLKTRLNGAYEPSFCSKLVATINPWKPVWDDYVLKNIERKPPSYASSTKHAEAVTCYRSIERWYGRFMRSNEGRNWVRLFNANVRDYHKLTDVKKVDFILWQLRG